MEDCICIKLPKETEKLQGLITVNQCCCCKEGSDGTGNIFQEYTMLYPNGGSKECPADVKLNQRYVLDNPYKGHIVFCQAEILYDGKWSATGFYGDFVSNAPVGCGVGVNQLLPDDTIVLQVGNHSILTHSNIMGNAFNLITPVIITASLPCRVRVFKLAKIAE